MVETTFWCHDALETGSIVPNEQAYAARCKRPQRPDLPPEPREMVGPLPLWRTRLLADDQGTQIRSIANSPPSVSRRWKRLHRRCIARWSAATPRLVFQPRG